MEIPVSGLSSGRRNQLCFEGWERKGRKRTNTEYLPHTSCGRHPPDPQVSPRNWQLLTHYTDDETQAQSRDSLCAFTVVEKGMGVEPPLSAMRGIGSRLSRLLTQQALQGPENEGTQPPQSEATS